MSSNIEKLKSTAMHLKEMINNSWDGIAIIAKNSKLIYVNDAFIPMLGYSKAELLDKNMIDLIGKDYKENFIKLLNSNYENNYTNDMTISCKRKDKKTIYLKVTASLMLNKKYFVLNAKDITKEISDDEILNNYVLSSHTDEKGYITEVSDAFCKITGYEKKELLNKKHSILRHPDNSPEFFAQLWEVITSGKEWSGKIKNKKKNGDTFWIDTKIKPIYNKYGDITGYTSLMFDITNELNLDEKVIDQSSKLKIMTDTITTISHEWRQPLNNISVLAQKLSIELDGEDNYITILKKIQDSVKGLSNTIEDFKNLVEFKGVKEPNNIKTLIETLIKPYKRMTNFEIVSDDIIIDIYEDRFVNVFNNVIQNSIEAMQKNSIEKRLIIIIVKKSEKDLEFEIIDNGGGIKKEIISRVFEPYFSTKDNKHGVGLGLFVSKNILELHLKGTISISSKNKNTSVSIKIPIEDKGSK